MFLGGLLRGSIVAVITAALTPFWVPGGEIYENRNAFKLILFLGGLGTMLGLEAAAWFRKRMSPDTPPDEFKRFFNSAGALLLVVIVGGMALALSTFVAVVYDTVVGVPSGPR